MASSSETIALFPLNIFLLPGESTRLHIFEERYKQLVSECVQGLLPGFGICSKNTANPPRYGSMVSLNRILHRYPGGEMDISITATSVFALRKFESQKPNKLYPSGTIELITLKDEPPGPDLMASWKEYLAVSDQLDNSVLRKEDLQLFDIAQTLFMSDAEKMDLVGLADHDARECYLINYLRYLEFLYEQEEGAKQGLYLN